MGYIDDEDSCEREWIDLMSLSIKKENFVVLGNIFGKSTKTTCPVQLDSSALPHTPLFLVK